MMYYSLFIHIIFQVLILLETVGIHIFWFLESYEETVIGSILHHCRWILQMALIHDTIEQSQLYCAQVYITNSLKPVTETFLIIL